MSVLTLAHSLTEQLACLRDFQSGFLAILVPEVWMHFRTISQKLIWTNKQAEIKEAIFDNSWRLNEYLFNTQISRRLNVKLRFINPVKAVEQFADWGMNYHSPPSPLAVAHIPNGQSGLPGLICWLIAFYSWAKDLSSVSVVSFILQIT